MRTQTHTRTQTAEGFSLKKHEVPRDIYLHACSPCIAISIKSFCIVSLRSPIKNRTCKIVSGFHLLPSPDDSPEEMSTRREEDSEDGEAYRRDKLEDCVCLKGEKGVTLSATQHSGFRRGCGTLGRGGVS